MRTVVVVPTYQEAANVVPFIDAVRAAAPDADLLVVDDNSPDGTGRLAEEHGGRVGRVEVLHRASKEGLGAAYRAGFARVLADGYDVVVQMDCDFSHDPAVIPILVGEVAAGADCAIGSRYVPGGSTPGWPTHRRLLSAYGNRYTAAVLGLGIHDATSGFRAYRAEALREIDVTGTRSNGYAFMSELAHRLVERGMVLCEVPITFRDRTRGTSKMSMAIIVESMIIVTWNAVRSRVSRWCSAGFGRRSRPRA